MIVIRNESVRKTMRYGIPFVLIPGVIAAGILLFGAGQQAPAILMVTLLSLLLFYAGFERKRTGSRRLVVVAVMTALCVAGRAIPLLKPVTVLSVLTAVYLGAESGFLVGSMAAVLSNLFFGMGPWTPFQMLAWGLCGYFAGCFPHALKQNRLLLVVYGLLAGILYSAVMDVWTVVWYNGVFSLPLYLAAAVTALPYTATYAVSNALWLFLLRIPIGEKLERLKIKYDV